MSVSFSNQLTPTNYPVNTRILKDATLSETVAMPVAAARANTGDIDLTVATPFPTTETINVYVDIGAAATANDGNDGAVILQHTSANSDATANGAAWANIPTIGPSTVTIAANAVAAQNWTYKLPPGCYQFIRATYVPIASCTDTLSDANLTCTLLF